MRRMRILTLLIASVAVLGGCGPTPSTTAPTPVDHSVARRAIARAELGRGDGVVELRALAEHADAAVRAAALRGLGRVGDTAALHALRQRVTTRVDALAAASALGIAGALGTVEEIEAAAISAELVALAGEGAAPTLLTALGRVGDASVLPTLTAALRGEDPAAAAAAGVALGRLGRRGIALDQAATAAAIARLTDDDAEVRYAAAYALARGYVAPPADANVGADAPAAATAPLADEAAAALGGALDDASAEVRALALLGLSRRSARHVAGLRATARLLDDDWRVAVEAVRLLVTADAAETDLTAVVAAVARAWRGVRTGALSPPHVHVAIEALRLLQGHARAPALQPLGAIVSTFTDVEPALALAAAHLRALMLGLEARRATSDDARGRALQGILDLDALPAASRATVMAEAAVDIAARDPLYGVTAIVVMMEREELAAAGLGQIAGLWGKLDDFTRPQALAAIEAALASPRADVTGSAADAAATILGQLVGDEAAVVAARAQLSRALLARLGEVAGDPELVSGMLTAVGGARLADALAPCRAGLGDRNPAVRQAARGCVQALGDADPGPGLALPLAVPDGLEPPAQLADGTRVTWILTTSRGEVRIALDPLRAPWHVASIVALTRRGFYDGLLFHRVVPGFVVQGGDPAGTGWGGPGYTLPAEPSEASYATGAVGIADAGKDTGGSQWFAMHGPAPHLDARYTQVGEIVVGAEVADALLIGDVVLAAAIAP